ncbi:hypothetical protein ADIWIN_1347 [Winogradskyella psychrotolerans RS-3]|uniref:Lipocalin-like domain-containing protein n=1 Tax=Winogradskyella psychrotolerans RS-3 TaxID=641526 RepID=S7VTZ6_9FLAO|nr:hypothetical protein [Winogradskyella psychrotolerans]EPR73710.1 hypothetical protein ADIWIN_1347 [Winogradskyella psychrotolerans RS-3]
MKNKLILIVMLVTVFSCSDDDFSSVNKIVDEWKLTEIRYYTPSGNSIIDYSDVNIIYDFRENGTLIVSGTEQGIYNNGTYEYEIEEGVVEGISDLVIFTVKIDQTYWTYDLTNGIMKLGISHVDGPDLIFERN